MNLSILTSHPVCREVKGGSDVSCRGAMAHIEILASHGHDAPSSCLSHDSNREDVYEQTAELPEEQNFLWLWPVEFWMKVCILPSPQSSAKTLQRAFFLVTYHREFL